MVTFDGIAAATAAHAALEPELAARLGRKVRVHFVVPVPDNVREMWHSFVWGKQCGPIALALGLILSRLFLQRV